MITPEGSSLKQNLSWEPKIVQTSSMNDLQVFAELNLYVCPSILGLCFIASDDEIMMNKIRIEHS